ncbi:family 78 glycoside hydrolase catalytic domain [Paenibacillus sp. GCM10027626]|uniref:family 78 glycoside hydrolase catalytic domain n=1 Tax=Paenibacillus sp. GCM10027626 TaxID=3273411 RepID=UPI0036415223
MEKQWKAKWVQDADFSHLQPIPCFHKELEMVEKAEHPPALQNRHMLVRKTFELSKLPQSAVLELTADDYYKLYVNGAFVGQGPAQGPYFHYYYNEFNILPFLRAGRNVIAIHVFYQGLINRAYNSGDLRQGLIAELTADEQVVVQTDATWKYKNAEQFVSGGTVGYDTQFLENIDQRRAEIGWREPDYDDRQWRHVVEAEAADYKFVRQLTPPLTVYEVRPQHIYELGAGHYMIDFGHELTGQFKMTARGSAGQTVNIFAGEELNEDGITVRYEMRCNCTYQERWTLAGQAAGEELELYEYKAFRYVEVQTEAEADPASFSTIVRHYPMDDSCQFSSSNALLDAVWSICREGIKYGTQENYVDCPSREKGQYLGDNTVITHAHAYLSGDLRMFRKALTDFAVSTSICPGMMGVAPGHYMQEIADFSLQWPLQLLQYYRQSGDLAFLREMYPYVTGLLDHFKRYERLDGLLELVTDKWNLVDWPVGMRDGYDFELSLPVGPGCHSVINAFYIGAVQAAGEMRKHVAAEGEGESEAAHLDRLIAAYNETFFDKKAKLYCDAAGSSHHSLHANVLPLYFGIVPDAAVASVVSLIKRKKLSCGVYMAYFVLEALASVQEYDEVYRLITSDELHSWGNMVKEGATTCFEAWSKDLKWNTSLCHPWASAPVPVMIEHIIGLQPAEPGWTAIRCEPHIPAELDRVSLQLKVPAGMISFHYENGAYKLQVPDGVQVV